MRQSLENLIQNAIVLQYKLPVNVAGLQIPRAHISTTNDGCLKQLGPNDDIARLIYNGIVEYAYNDNEIDHTRLNNLQMRALQSKLKYNPTMGHRTKRFFQWSGKMGERF